MGAFLHIGPMPITVFLFPRSALSITPNFFGLKGRRDTARGETPGIATTDGLPSLCGLEDRGDASPAVGVVRGPPVALQAARIRVAPPIRGFHPGLGSGGPSGQKLWVLHGGSALELRRI